MTKKYPIFDLATIDEKDKLMIESKEVSEKKKKNTIEAKDSTEIALSIMQEELDEETKKSSPKNKPKEPEKEVKITVGGNNGKRWTADEEKKLLDNIKTKTIKEAAEIHKRTEGGIKSRLKEIAYKMHTEKKSVADIKKATKLTEAEINKVIERKGLGKKEIADEDLASLERDLALYEKHVEGKK